jgi:hypothetical protein
MKKLLTIAAATRPMIAVLAAVGGFALGVWLMVGVNRVREFVWRLRYDRLVASVRASNARNHDLAVLERVHSIEDP